MRKFSFSLLFAIMLLGMFAAGASAADHGNNQNGMPSGAAGKVNLNANETGQGVDDPGVNHSVVKALTGQHVHSSYQNNTNSCASCHQVHTAQGDSLLFADTVYNTCTACHDGTLGYLNVFTDGSLSADATKAMSGAGTFGGTHGSSQHMSNDSLQITAAPGGNPTSTSKEYGSQWGESFNCASCHAPHGSYSDRLLAYNPNGIAAMPVSKGGNQLENVPVYDQAAGQTVDEALKDKTDAVVLLRSEDAVADANGHKKVTVAQYNKNGATYKKSEAPWFYGYVGRTDGLSYYTRLQYVKLGDNPATKDKVETEYDFPVYGSTSGVYFDYEKAQVYSTSAAGATELKAATIGFIARPIVVKMAKSGYDVIQKAYFSGAPLKDFGNGKATEQQMKDFGYKVGTDADKTVTNVGVKMSQFCAACHTDYLQSSSDSTAEKQKLGKNTHFADGVSSYRHSTNSDGYTCVRCHYGHGTDAYIMKDALGRTIQDLTSESKMGTGKAMTEPDALNYMQDNNASSALKKFTNMSVCWACHNSSHAEVIKNAERPADHPNGMPTNY